jgi:hypothetical protein
VTRNTPVSKVVPGGYGLGVFGVGDPFADGQHLTPSDRGRVNISQQDELIRAALKRPDDQPGHRAQAGGYRPGLPRWASCVSA